jgi:hypothetical protein
VLPADLADDSDRLRRFEREAKTLASLNHPNVAGIHGIDQVGDTCFLAMELVPGEDLAARLLAGPLRVDEAVDVCRQIAEGLEAAHEAGVVHRDLKPANVRLTPEGAVKILDFGLAKPLVPGAGKDTSSTAQSDSFLMTEEGVVLGTPTYMSPEQARGRPVDRRTDVWAFGCVLYECLTGRRAFSGETFGDIVAAVLSGEPDWSALPALPPRVAELLQRALTKDPRARLRDMGEARVQLELAKLEASTTGTGTHASGGIIGAVGTAGTASSGAARSGARTALGAAVLAAAALTVGYFAGGGGSTDSGLGLGPASADDPAGRPALHALIHQFDEGDKQAILSPDGRRVVWADEGLWVRSLGDLEPRKIHDGSGQAVRWAPDSRELAYLEDGHAWRLPADGGRATRVEGSEHDGFSHLSWLDDGRLVIGNSDGVWAVPADGGKREQLLELDETGFAHWHLMHPLPDGRGILGALHRMTGSMDTIEVFRDGTSEVVFEVPDGNFNRVQLTTDGTLVYGEDQREKGVWSVPFSLTDLEATGEPRLHVAGATNPSVSDDGMLAYEIADAESDLRQLAWLDRTDGELALLDQPHENLRDARLSADGRLIAFHTGPPSRPDVWVLDMERGVASPRLRFEGFLLSSVWLPDGRLALSRPMEPPGTYVYSLTGRGEPEQLSDALLFDVSPDGQTFVIGTFGPDLRETVVSMVGPGPGGEVLPYLRNEDDDRFECFSPDGNWMLYTSRRTGTRQLYLSRFPPDADEDWLVSADALMQAWFRDDLGEILYATGSRREGSGQIFAVSLVTEPEVRLGTPEIVLEIDEGMSVEDYDGKDRFLVLPMGAPGTSSLYVDTGWAKDG